MGCLDSAEALPRCSQATPCTLAPIGGPPGRRSLRTGATGPPAARPAPQAARGAPFGAQGGGPLWRRYSLFRLLHRLPTVAPTAAQHPAPLPRSTRPPDFSPLSLRSQQPRRRAHHRNAAAPVAAPRLQPREGAAPLAAARPPPQPAALRRRDAAPRQGRPATRCAAVAADRQRQRGGGASPLLAAAARRAAAGGGAVSGRRGLQRCCVPAHLALPVGQPSRVRFCAAAWVPAAPRGGYHTAAGAGCACWVAWPPVERQRWRRCEQLLGVLLHAPCPPSSGSIFGESWAQRPAAAAVSG